MSQATALLADAETSIKAGEWDQALEQLENLKKDQPSQPEVYEKLAHVLAVRGKFQSVISTYLELITVLVEAESLEHADGIVSQVLALRPESGEARERRIEIENKRGNVARAVYLSRELARLCIDQGDGERSIRLLQDALKHEPGNLDIALELAEMFVSHGHIQDGANQYRKVANAFQAAGNISKAAEAYRRMKVVQSDDPEVLLTLGRLYTELGKLDEAEQEFRSVLRHDLDHEQALLQLGLVCQLKGRFRSGILAFNKVLQNNPNLVTAKRKLGELHHSQGMMTEAVDFFLQAAQGHLEAEERDDAIECFQIILSVDENNAPAQQGLTNLGAPVQPRAFEPPLPPTPPEEEAAVPEPPPPPPVPFASAPMLTPSAVAMEQTERLPQMNFDAPPEAAPARPEVPPKRPSGAGSASATGSSSSSGSSSGGGFRKGLMGGGLSMKQGLDKPMLGGDKPTLGARGLGGGGVRKGLVGKTMGGGAGEDKPMLGGPSGPGDRRPSFSPPGRPEPTPVGGGTTPTRPPFHDSAPLEDFSADMALEDVFSEPGPPSGDPVAPVDDDFALPDSLFDDDAPSASSLSLGDDDLFGSIDEGSPSADGGGPVIGAFSFDSDDDGGDSGAPSTLRPTYAQETPTDLGDDLSDDLFNFGADASSPQPSQAPTLARGGLFGEDDAGSGDDLFGDDAGGGDLFGGGGDDLFGTEPSPAARSGAAGLFDQDSPSSASASDQGLFDGEGDPFEDLFGEPSAADPQAAETIGGGKPAANDFFFDDDGPESDAPVGESDFGGLFGDPEEDGKSIPLSVGDDLFGGGDDDFFGEPAAAANPAPTIASGRDEGLFSNDSDSNDLFGDDDLFSGPEAGGDLNPGFSSPLEMSVPQPEAPGYATDDLFSGPDEGLEFDGPSGGLDIPLEEAGFESENLFGGDEAAGDLFGEAASDDGLFGSSSSSGDLFGDDSDPSSSLFDEPSSAGSGNGDFLSSAGHANGSGDGLFGSDYGEPASVADDGGLFDGLGSDSDTLFEGFDDARVAPDNAQSLPVEPQGALSSLESGSSMADDDLFGGSGSDDLFGDGGDDLFGEPEPIEIPSPQSATSAEEADDLFGEFSSSDDRDDVHPPLSSGGDDLFGEPDDDGSLFDLPLTIPEPSQAAPEALAFVDEPAPISIPDPGFPTEPANDSLFGNETDGDDLFGSMELDDSPLDLDLPMPGDKPAVAAPVAESSTDWGDSSEPQDGGGGLFDDPGDSMSDLFGNNDDLDAPLTFEIPEPSEEPVAPMAVVEPEPEPEPEPDYSEPEESAEFMAILDLTMPKMEEEPPPPALVFEDEPVFMPEPAPGDSLDIPVSFGVEDDLFEPSIELAPSIETEPAPVVEEEPVEIDPISLLSVEEQTEIAHTAQADALETSLAGADAASKIAAYRKILEENPDNLVLRTRLADIHLKFGLLEDAVVQYRQVMRRNPDSIPLLHSVIQAEFWNENYVEAGDSLLALAHLHLKRGEQHEALDTLQSVLSLDPLHFEARKELVSVFTSLDESKLAAHHLRQLAETALTKGEVSGAILAFQQLLEISADPTFEERLAQIYESQGDVEKALSSFQSLVGRYRAEERWEEAARVTERIVELDPNQLDDREALVALYQHLGQIEQAVDQQFQLARRYQERNEVERSIALFEEVLKHQLGNFEARRHLVDAYLDAGRVSAALEQAESLTEHYLDTKDHHTAIALYSRLVGADPENVELQERLVKFYGLAGDPENAKSRWIHISNLHETNGRYDRAAEAVQKAIELDEGQIELQHRLALLYAERLHDNQSALGQLRKLFQMAPDRTDAVKMYIDLLLKEEQVSEAGQVLQRLEQAGGESVEIKSNVIASLKASVESNPGDLKARFNYGELCYHLGDLDHAIEQFQQTRRHPDFELISYNMLGLCFASKRGYMMLDLAIKQFQKGLESKGRSEQDYLEIRYNLAMVQYQNGRAKEALAELKECYNVDIAYRDVRSWIQKIEGELNSAGT